MDEHQRNEKKSGRDKDDRPQQLELFAKGEEMEHVPVLDYVYCSTGCLRLWAACRLVEPWDR